MFLQKKYLLLKYIFACSIFCIALFSLTACVKTIDLKMDTYSTTNLKVSDDVLFDSLDIIIDDQVANDESSKVISVNGEKYRISVVISINNNIEPVKNLYITYYSKKLRIVFDFRENEVFLYGELRQKTGEIYMDASIKLGKYGVDFKLT